MSWDYRRLIVLMAALLTAGLGLRLGIWQLDRAAQKQALQAALAQRSTLPPLPQAELATQAGDVAAQLQRRVRLRGQWLPEATVFLDNRQMHGRPGFFVMTPLHLVSGAAVEASSSAPLVWVQRGWTARDNNERARVPLVPTPAGVVEVVGRVAPAPARLYQFATDAGGAIRQNLDLDESARALGRRVAPLTVLQTDAPADGADGLLRDWPLPAVDIHKHHGYAFQWFALSFLITGLYVWFQVIRPWRRREQPA